MTSEETKALPPELGGVPVRTSEVIPVEQARKKVAIIGFTNSRKLAPWDDGEWEIWCINALYKFKDITRVTRWFDLHDREKIDPHRLAQYAKFAESNVPVYLQQEWPDIPTSVEFPADELRLRFGRRYFTNTISWLIAYAIHLGMEEIGIWGVDMSQDTEYRHQRPNVEYFIGVAEGLGIKVTVPESSDLMMATHEYGYGTDQGLRKKLLEREAYFREMIGGSRQQANKHQQQIAQHQAKIDEINRKILVWEGARQQTNWMLQSGCVVDSDSFEPDAARLENGGPLEIGEAATISADEVENRSLVLADAE
jgi:hypothetical protein